MQSQLLINSTFKETRVALTENNKLIELFIERRTVPPIVGNIYKGKVGKIVPGMQAAFVDIGAEKSGFISVEDVYEESFIELFLDDKEQINENKESQQLIQDMLNEGQEVIVQAIKEPVSNKGAKLTSYIGIPGKYLVLIGTVDMVGVSRRIDDEDERKRLFDIISDNKPNDIGFIARTACLEVDDEEIINEIKFLARFWKKIKKKSEKAPTPSKIYEEPSLYIRAVRDLLGNDVSKIIVDSKKSYGEIKKYFSNRALNDFKIDTYTDSEPLFKKYNIEDQIKKIYWKKVWLKSGGSLIIDEAEGLTVIDVNTGKYTSNGDQEEMIFKINKEAALESARQIRLRNLVGIIVIDFIDLRANESRDKIFEIFSDELKKDRSRTVIQDISLFGVIQLTRQRVRESVLSVLTETCHLCSGTGKIKSIYTTCYELLREIEYQAKLNTNKTLMVYANKEVVNKLREIEERSIKKIQKSNNTKVRFKKTSDIVDNFNIVVE